MLTRKVQLTRRTPLKRSSALGRSAFGASPMPLSSLRAAPLKRASRLRARRPEQRRSSRVIDLPRRRWIASLDCCACGRSGPSHPHHRTLTGRGKSQKSDDTECMPLCFQCHDDLHGLRGRFRGFTRERLDEWQRLQVAIYQGWFARLFATREAV